MLNEERFATLLIATAELYGKELSPIAINLYYEVLKNYSNEQVNKAFNFVIRTNKYNCLPKPAEVIEAIEGKEDERAIVAWQGIIEAIRNYGYYQSIEFEDKIIHVCIDHLGGWMWLCGQTRDELKFIGKDFVRLYRTFEKHPRKASEKLIGYFEQQNLIGGYLDSIPKLIHIKKNGTLSISDQRT